MDFTRIEPWTSHIWSYLTHNLACETGFIILSTSLVKNKNLED